MKPISAKWILIFLALFWLSGCASLEYPRTHSVSIKEALHSFSYTADLRAVHFIKNGDRYWILTEPPPDAAFSYDDADSMNLSLLSFGGKGQDTGEVSEGSEDLPLTGRTSYVLLARELLFRLNEMSYNTGASKEQTIELYKKVLSIIQDVAQAESKNITYQTKMNLTTGASSALSLKESETSGTSSSDSEETSSSSSSSESSSSSTENSSSSSEDDS